MSERKDWLDKLNSERPLTLQDAHRLDEALENQHAVKHLVSGLSEEEPSLAWRSQLNERLLASQPRPKSSFKIWAGRFGLGTAVAACAFGVLVMVQRPKMGAPIPSTASQMTTSAEQILIDAHESAAFAAATGSGDGTSPTQSLQSDPGIQWTEADLGAF